MGTATPVFDQARQDLARRYYRWSMTLGFGSTFLLGAVALAALLTSLSSSLETWAMSLTHNAWGVVSLYIIVAYLFLALLGLPLRIAGRILDLGFGLTRQSWASWAVDRLKGLGLGLGATILVVEVLYWTLRNFGPLWWPIFWGLTTIFAILAGWLAPVLLLPIFYKVRRVEDQALVQRLQVLASRAGVKAVGVYEFASSPKTERGTAALAGFGRTRRILLSDHILRDFSPEEVEGILAHELAHHIRGDAILYTVHMIITSLGVLYLIDLFMRALMPAFGIPTMSSVSGFPLFILLAMLFNAMVAPASRYISRRRESAADRRGAELCGNPQALASALVKLHNTNLAYAYPHPAVEALFYTHPSGQRRVSTLLSMREASRSHESY